jgi:hypothetical protein
MATTRSGSAKAAEQGEQGEVVVLWAPFPGHQPRRARVRPALRLIARGLCWRLSPSGVMEEAAMMDDELRQKNAFLRDKIKEISDRHPELRDLSDKSRSNRARMWRLALRSLSGSTASCRSGREPSSSTARIWSAFLKTSRPNFTSPYSASVARNASGLRTKIRP